MAAPFQTVDADRLRRSVGVHDTLIYRPHRARTPPAPLPVLAVPVIVIVDGDDPPVEPGIKDIPGIAESRQLEAGRSALFGATLEILADTEIDIPRPVGDAHTFGYRASTRLHHTDIRIETQGIAGLIAPPAGIKTHGCAARAIGRLGFELDDLLAELFVGAAKFKAVKRLERARIGFKPRLSLNRQARARRAIEKPAFHRDQP